MTLDSANRSEFSRGIAPAILLQQVRNTVPFVFESQAHGFDQVPYLKELRDRATHSEGDLQALSHFDYFRLCVCAHFGTVSSYVPTDVDNQIRFRLWHPGLPEDVLTAMVALTLEARHWNLTPVSARYVVGPKTGRVLSGLSGEWFSIAAAAYCASRKKNPELAQTIATAIREELCREAEILREFALARAGVGLLQAATTIAHNLGDLDRVMDQWELDSEDPLRKDCYKTGHEDSPRSQDPTLRELRPWLLEAGALNKAPLTPTSMADENHRHFALRAAKCLRRSPELLLPIAPFYDDWGRRLGRHPALTPEEIAEVVECLIDGWEKLKPLGKTQTYPRALAGIESSFPGGLARLCQYLPSRAAKTLRSGALRTYCATPQARFEEQWGTQALMKLKRPGALSTSQK
ncbi:MAG: hypothetical protein RJB38_1034 [Pseudomonadota bacterium]|jgi:hypothetical protein